jgi:ribosomal protein L3 glutamine methyltransferase
MNVRECVDQVAASFEANELCYGHGTDNAWDEAIYLVFSVLRLPFDSTEEVAVRAVSAQDSRIIANLAKRRIHERIPVAYLVGEAWFAGLCFWVDSRVLIPRSPIAELINSGFEPMLKTEPARVLDLCTGSGCIGIATAVAFPGAQVDLADISAEALAVAARNIARHDLQVRVLALQSDLFLSLTEHCRQAGKYDLIVSNPPYVSAAEVADLPAEYQREPALGLLSDDDGLAIPLRILRSAADYLNPGGLLILELGYSWQLLAARYPQLPVTWLEFDSGGEGVLAIDREALIRAQEALRV